MVYLILNQVLVTLSPPGSNVDIIIIIIIYFLF